MASYKRSKKPDVEEYENLHSHSKKFKRSMKETDLDNSLFKSATDTNKTISTKESLNTPWSIQDHEELIRRMESQTPKDDFLLFKSRVGKLDWEKIRFKNHSVEDCKSKWKYLKTKVRTVRLLSEILQDLKIYVKNPASDKLGGKRNKKARHPEKPTRPLSSFMLFYLEKKPIVMNKDPSLKCTEVSRIVGEMYKRLPEEKKAHYIEKAKDYIEEYKEKLKEFYDKYPECASPKKKKKCNPLKPVTPFKLYLRSKIEKHQHDEKFDQAEYKEMWKNLSGRKKAYWIKLAKDYEIQFMEQAENYELEHNDEMPLIYKSVISKEENAILDRLAGKPEKPPHSGYGLFSKLMLQKKDEFDYAPNNKMKDIAIQWKNLSQLEKKSYDYKATHMLEMYKLDFANYLESLPDEKREEELAKLQPKKRKRIVKPKQIDFKVEPLKPPGSTRELFEQEYVRNHDELSTKTALKNADDLWNILSNEEKQKYTEKHRMVQMQYIKDYEAFLHSLSEEEFQQYSVKKQHSDKELEISVNKNVMEPESEEEVEEEEEEEEKEESDGSSDDDDSVSEDDEDTDESRSDTYEEDT